MIQFMLTDLCRSASEFQILPLPIHIVIFYFTVFIPCSLSLTSKKNTIFLFLIMSNLFKRDGWNITFSTNPICTMIPHFFSPIILVAVPRHIARLSCIVSSKSPHICRSVFATGSNYCRGKKTSFLIGSTIFSFSIKSYYHYSSKTIFLP